MCEHEYLFKVCDLKRKYLVMKKKKKLRLNLNNEVAC